MAAWPSSTRASKSSSCHRCPNQPTIRSRGRQFPVVTPTPPPVSERPPSWAEVRRRARATSGESAHVENGRPTSGHPWRRAIAADIARATNTKP
jgi:hypothetical protein